MDPRNNGNNDDTEIITLLQPRLNIIQQIVTKTNKYLAIVKDIIMSLNPSEYNKTMDVIQKLTSCIVNIQKSASDLHGATESATILPIINNIYSNFVAIDEYFVSIFALYDNENYLKLAIHNMSSTYTSDIYRARASIMSDHEKYSSLAAQDDSIIFNTILPIHDRDKKINKLDPAASLLFVEQNTEVNKFTIKLLHWIISNTNGDVRRRAEQIVEVQKDKVMGSSRQMLQYPGAQGILSRYNLVPVTRSMPLANLFAQIGTKYDDNSTVDQNFSKLNTAMNIGVCALWKQTTSPIEFDLSALIDLNYIISHDLKTNPASGITKKVLEKFNTAKLLNKSDIRAEQYKIYPVNVTNVANWYVFETINGIDWRLLGHHSHEKIPNTAILGLIHGLSLRPHCYNTMCAESILSKCFDANSAHLLSDYEKLRINAPASDTIRTNIIDKILQAYDKLPLPTSIEDLQVIDQNVINKVLLDVLIHTTGIHGKGSLEYMITYIAKIEGIVKALIKELLRRWADIELPSRFFVENTGNELRNAARDIVRSVVTSAVDELDRAHTWTDYDMTLKEFFLEQKQAII